MKNRIKLHIDIKALIKFIAQGIRYGWTRFKNGYKNYLAGKPKYVVRAVSALVIGVLLCILLRDFTKIPVRDYYFDIYSASYDSIVPDIKVVVGNTNMLNTYSDEFNSQGDSISIKFDIKPHSESYERKIYSELFPYSNGPRVFQKGPSYAARVIEQVMDSVSRLSKLDNKYTHFVKTYEHDKALEFWEKDSLQTTYIYTQAYLNRFSSAPIGYKKITKIVYQMPEQVGPISNMKIAWDMFRTDLLSGKPFLGDTLLCKKLSDNHSYLSVNILCTKNDRTNGGYLWMNMRNTIQRIHITDRLFARWNLFWSRENIALKEYRFCVHPHDIDAYKITLQTRGGAVIQNNPSDELQVLNLHDTQITKRKITDEECTSDEARILSEKFYNSDVFVSIPENDGLQYIRLFFITLVIGWMLLACFKNIAKFVRKCFDV